MKQIASEQDLTELSRSAWSYAVLAAWADCGLLALLAERYEPVSLDELPGSPRALRATAPVLAHLGILFGDGDSWTLAPRARHMLAAGEFDIGSSLRWLGDLSRLGDVLNNGGPVVDDQGKSRVTKGGVRPESPQETRKFLDRLYRLSAHTAPITAQWVLRRLPSNPHILDIGGGHGRYAECFTEGGAQVTLFDMDLVVDIAKERYGDRLSYRAGNFHDDDFGGPYDCAFLSNIVHSEGDEEIQDMLARVHGALAPGGWLVIKDMFIDEQGRDPAQAVYFGLTMLYYTASGQSYRMEDVRRWYTAIGFGQPEIVAMDNHVLVFAQKPGGAHSGN